MTDETDVLEENTMTEETDVLEENTTTEKTDVLEENTTGDNETPKIPRRGIGTVIKEAILQNKTNAEALEAAKAEFPNSNTTAATVSWYRNDLRKKGHEVLTARELKKKAEAEAAASQIEGTAEGTAEDPLG